MCVSLFHVKLFHGATFFYVPRSKISADFALFAEIRDRRRRFLIDGEHCPPSESEPGQCRLRVVANDFRKGAEAARVNVPARL